MIFCPKCGALIPPNGGCCPQCGASVDMAVTEHMEKTDTGKRVEPSEKERKTIAESLCKILDFIPDWINVLYRIAFVFAILAAVFRAVALAQEYKKAEGTTSEASYLYEESNRTKNETVPLSTKPARKEIIFRDIPWGTSYDDVVSQIPDVTFYPFTGEIYKTYSVDQIITGDGLRFENSDINISGNSVYGSLSVAGYQTTDVDLYFAYVPVNGVLTKEKADSAFYGASYEFTPEDTKGMASDLKEKLTSIYGEASKTTQDKDLWGGVVKYTYWYGANDTLLVLCVDDESASRWKSTEKIRIVYAWREGDKLLQEASDCLKREAVANERSNFGDGNTNGL